jgi:hypothetical protein
MKLKIKRWIFRRITNENERRMINDTLMNAYFMHKRGEKAGKPKWTPEGVLILHDLEKLVKR